VARRTPCPQGGAQPARAMQAALYNEEGRQEHSRTRPPSRASSPRGTDGLGGGRCRHHCSRPVARWVVAEAVVLIYLNRSDRTMATE